MDKKNAEQDIKFIKEVLNQPTKTAGKAHGTLPSTSRTGKV